MVVVDRVQFPGHAAGEVALGALSNAGSLISGRRSLPRSRKLPSRKMGGIERRRAVCFVLLTTTTRCKGER